MFEAKIEEKRKEIIKSSEDEQYVEALWQQKIDEVIDSLTEKEFVGLQTSLENTFREVEQLFHLVKTGLESGKSCLEITKEIEEVWSHSSEKSHYYQMQYLNLVRFLSTVSTDVTDHFQVEMEQPFQEMKEAILQSVQTKTELRESRNNPPSKEIVEAYAIYQLCHEIWNQLGFDVTNLSLTSSVYEKLFDFISSMLQMKNQILYVVRENQIMSCINIMNQQIEQYKIDANEVQDKIEELYPIEKFQFSIKEKDQSLADLIKLLEAIELPSQDSFHDKNIKQALRMIQNSSHFVRYFIFKNYKIIPQIIPHNYGEFTGSIDLTTLLRVLKLYSYCSDTIDQEKNQTIEKINRIFDLEILDGLVVEEIPNTPFYCKEFGKLVIHETSLEGIQKKILKQKRLGAFRGIVYQFYLSLVHEEKEREQIKEKIASGKLDSIISKVVERIETVFTSFPPEFGIHFKDINLNLMEMYDQLEEVRAVSEEDVLDAVIGKQPIVYEKKIKE